MAASATPKTTLFITAISQMPIDEATHPLATSPKSAYPLDCCITERPGQQVKGLRFPVWTP
jgi:hypothetical protein